MVSEISDSPQYGQFWTLSSDFGGFDTDTMYGHRQPSLQLGQPDQQQAQVGFGVHREFG